MGSGPCLWLFCTVSSYPKAVEISPLSLWALRAEVELQRGCLCRPLGVLGGSMLAGAEHLLYVLQSRL